VYGYCHCQSHAPTPSGQALASVSAVRTVSGAVEVQGDQQGSVV